MADSRQISIKTPLGAGVLRLVAMQGSEELGRLYQYQLVLYSENPAIAIDDILGQNVTVKLLGPQGRPRFFNGFVTRFSQVGWSEHGLSIYRATVSPWLWFLTRTADCRIFQEQTVVDIVKTVFNDNGFSDFDVALSGSYRQREYCVQYRESDFEFVSRLLEEEGIYYFFRHQDGLHKLVLADDSSSHAAIEGDSSLPFHPPGRDQTVDREHVSHWLVEREIQSGSFALQDYDFKKPRTDLSVSGAIARQNAQADGEVFDYPGNYVEAADGERYARARIEQLQVGFEQVSASTDARFMATGGLFTLAEHPRGDQNREYLVIRASYALHGDEYATGSGAEERPYACDLTAIESKTPYRAARVTPRPVVSGPQTAVVVGPSGEEIYPDEFGRVRVQFHWDRQGRDDENSSCWVRVAQIWAGTGWGAQFLPRIGQEVVVEFLEGDPDRPLITGRLYNADNKPPYALPASKTQSGIKSRSSKGASASNFNEIRLEDKKGSEEFYVQAEKDYKQHIKNDRAETVGNNRSLDVGKDKSETVGNDKSISVGKNFTEDVGESTTITVGKKYLLEAGDEITLKTGQASITMKKDGSITIKGKDIKITGSGAVDVKASKNITMKGKKILQN